MRKEIATLGFSLASTHVIKSVWRRKNDLRRAETKIGKNKIKKTNLKLLAES